MPSYQHGLRATAVHTAITLLVLVALLFWVREAWYTPLLFSSNGGWHGLAIITVVALVSGPLLTYVIENPDKARHLIVFDLVVIAVVQLLALAYGIYTVHNTRPVVLAYWDGRIYPVSHSVLAIQDVKPSAIAELDDHHPPLVFVRGPQTREEARAIVDYGFSQNLSEPALAFLYEPFDQHVDTVFTASVEKRAKPHPIWIDTRNRYLETHIMAGDYAFIPMVGSAGDSLLIINRAGDPMEALSLP